MSLQTDKMQLMYANNGIEYEVWYAMLTNDQQYPETNGIVKPGNNVNTIKKNIIAQSSRLFDDVSLMEMEIYTSTAIQEQLDPATEWNQTVPLGTSEEPLIVKVNRQSFDRPVTKSMPYIL
jgi:hypothetical protein